jgi:UDP-N-acetylmuramyl pentapeptide phosphotransferase/UDP-N-acetylglucosamine-1-phosphate transferase
LNGLELKASGFRAVHCFSSSPSGCYWPLFFLFSYRLLLGKKVIRLLQRRQIGESVRDLGLAGEQQKKGTPTMGGIIIILSYFIPTLLLANLEKVYVRLMILSTLWLGADWFY